MTSSPTVMAWLKSWKFNVTLLLMLFFATEVQSESCPVYSGGYYSGYQNCVNGCCGHYPNYYCCDISSAAIAGIILGSIVVICVLVFLCAYCMKKKNHTSQVIRPVQPAAATSTIVFTGTSGRLAGPVHPATQAPRPPPYKQHDLPPPYSDVTGNNNQYGHHHPGPGHTVPHANQYGQQQPSTQAYPYGTRPMGSTAVPNCPPPQYSSAAPSNIAPPAAVPPAATSSAASRQYSYGQSHGWSAAGDANSSATPSAVPSTSATAAPPSTAASSSLGPTAPSQGGFGQGQGWPEPAPNRNTITTRNFPRNLPPLPHD